MGGREGRRTANSILTRTLLTGTGTSAAKVRMWDVKTQVSREVGREEGRETRGA